MGDAKSRWGTLTLDVGTRPPYNLSTGFVCFRLYVCSHFIVQYYFVLSDRALYRMKDDFFIFHTGNFLPFHIPIHTKIFHCIFHSILKFSSIFHFILPYQDKFRPEATRNLHCTFATLSVSLEVVARKGKQYRTILSHF